MNPTTILLPSITFIFLTIVTTCSSLNTIALNQNITDGETIISENETYEMGFFSPGASKNRYLGIWFKNTSPPTVLWVANRETPLINTSGMVTLDSRGILSLVDGGGTVIWSSNSSATNIVNPVTQLLDTGNLVIKDDNHFTNENFIWQSFDYPGDTYVSGMKLGKDLVTGRDIQLTSWKSADDPSSGEYTVWFLMAKGKYPQQYIRKNMVIEARIGPYNGIAFAGQPPSDVERVFNLKEMYFVHTFNSTGYLLRLILTLRGKLETWQLNQRTREWMQVHFTLPRDDCDKYGLCGPYGSCSIENSPNCGCLKGFELTSQDELSRENWTSGCRRSVALDCGPGEGFLKFSSMKLPDTQNAVFDGKMSLQECEVACKNNCLCTAYANPNISQGGVGCLQWFGDLIDVRVFEINGQDLYVRLAASELLGKLKHYHLN